MIPELKATMLQVKIGVCLELFDGVTTIVAARAKPDLILLITGWEGKRKNPISPERLAKMMEIALRCHEEEEREKKSYLTYFLPKMVQVKLTPCSSSDAHMVSTSGKRVCEGLMFFKTDVKSFLKLFRSKHPRAKTCGVLHGPILRLMPEHESNSSTLPIAVIPDPEEMRQLNLYATNNWHIYKIEKGERMQEFDKMNTIKGVA